MQAPVAFRCRETARFLVAMTTSREGRGILYSHAFNTMILALLLLAAMTVTLFGLMEGHVLKRRTLIAAYGMLFLVLLVGPLATMPFFSFKDVLDRAARAVTRRRMFVVLSRHVFYRHTFIGGHISLHLAKAHAVLGEKYRLLSRPRARPQETGRRLSLSLGRSIRMAMRRSRRLVQNGRLNRDEMIVGATYGYLFGAAKSKLRLRRCEPSRLQRFLFSVFYRYGALHAVYMYFIIHDRLPTTFDPVYFMARVGDVVDAPGV